MPDQSVLIDAAIVAGILCRLRGSYAGDHRMKALPDATPYFQAIKARCTLPTANVTDVVLQQRQPEGRVLFYAAV